MLNISISLLSQFIKKTQLFTIIIIGFALFSMFFGAGNLIFPINIGVETQDNFIAGCVGLLFTGIIVPLIGLLSVLHSKNSDLIDYFSPLGKGLAYIMTFIILVLLGPVIIIPRSIMVAGQACKILLPFLHLSIIKFLICIILAVLTITRNNIIDLLGKYLTPVLLLGIAIVIGLGITQGIPIEPSNLSILSAFSIGFIEGYQTMDLLAALIFALIVIKYIKEKQSMEGSTLSFSHISHFACLVCAILLFIIYFGFILLGAQHHSIISLIDPSQRLLVIATNILGHYSIPIISVIIFLACLTTMCAVAEIFADFSANYINLNKSILILVGITISYFISLIEFKTLATNMAYLLKILYPALIAYTILKLLIPSLSNKLISICFWLVLLISSIY